MLHPRPVIGLLLTLCFGASAGAEVIPIPRPKPAHVQTPPALVPLPRPNPRRSVADSVEDQSAASDGWSAASIKEARQACASLLQGHELAYRPLAPLGGAKGCGAPAPVEVSAAGGLELAPPATLTCPMARSLATWLSASVRPAARRLLKSEITTVHVAASYVCRRRNNQAGGKLSEHARANAIDLSGFSFAGAKDATVGGSWGGGLMATIGLGGGGSFLATIRGEACASFTTVLGPGSDPYHGDHFHLDMLARKGEYRICQ